MDFLFSHFYPTGILANVTLPPPPPPHNNNNSRPWKEYSYLMVPHNRILLWDNCTQYLIYNAFSLQLSRSFHRYIFISVKFCCIITLKYLFVIGNIWLYIANLLRKKQKQKKIASLALGYVTFWREIVSWCIVIGRDLRCTSHLFKTLIKFLLNAAFRFSNFRREKLKHTVATKQ